MPESQEPTSGQQPAMSMAGNAPPPKEQVQSPTQRQGQGPQELDPAILALFTEDGDAAVDDDADADISQMEALRLLFRQFSFVIIPFLFAIATFLLAFLIGSGSHSSLPMAELWAIGLIALAMAVLQGMMLYYSGSNNGLWFLSLLAGFILFPPVLFFTLAGPAASLITLAIMIVVCVVVAWLCSRTVPEGHVGLVYSFGKYRRTLPPGLNFLPPWESMKHVLDTREAQWTCPPQTVHMSPDKDLTLAATIAYQIIPEDAHLAVLHVNKWEQQLRERFRATLQTIAIEFKPEDFYPWQQGSTTRSPINAASSANANPQRGETPGWSRMNARLLQLMRDQVAPWGVQINWVRIHDVTPLPHVQGAETVRVGAGAVSMAAANSSQPSRPGTTQAAPASSQRQSSSTVGSEGAPGAKTTQASPAAAAQAGAANDGKKDEALIKLYDAVRNGTITDPETIRRWAARFEAIAHDPVASQNFPFDAGRAANNLYARAKYYEEQISASAEFMYDEDVNDEYNDVEIVDDMSEETQSDWLHQPPPDDHLTGGG
jgi:regulator of protease activity HflC (stomatin/prohibitin superfamily)